jgi:hypothetical protein
MSADRSLHGSHFWAWNDELCFTNDNDGVERRKSGNSQAIYIAL